MFPRRLEWLARVPWQGGEGAGAGVNEEQRGWLMDFRNTTRFPGMLYRAAVDEDRFAAAALLRVTFDLIDGGMLEPSEAQPWIVSPGPWKGPRGLMESDNVFYRGGTDLFLWGHATAPRGRSVPHLTVSLRVGDGFRRDVKVWGDRVWQRSRGGLVPSRPAYFSRVSLGPENAFGGSTQVDGRDAPYPDNPDGKGYYEEEAEAEGKPLPNLEKPGAGVARWDDRPTPVLLGPCPLQHSLRLRNGLAIDDQGHITAIRPHLFNAASPNMIAKQVLPGAEVEILGVSPDGPLRFRLPSTLPRVRVVLGRPVADRELRIDQVGMDLIDQKVFVTYRHPFRYRFQPHQERSCEILWPAHA